MSNIKISSIWALLLIIPLLLFVIIPFVKMKDGKRKAKNIISLIIHITICILLTLAISNIEILRSSKNTELYVLADVSISNEDNYEKMDNSLKELSSKIDINTKIGLVCFAKNYELLSPLGTNLKSVSSSHVDKSATDLESALKYTATLYHDNVIKKLLIISDGLETDNHSINAIEQLRAENINVDALSLDRAMLANEVQINGVDYTKVTYTKKEETLKVSLQAGKDNNVTLNLYKNNELEATQNLLLNRGINIATFKLDTLQSGIYDYKVQVESEDDYYKDNNEFYFTQNVSAEYKVLVIGNTLSDCESVSEFYTWPCDVSSYFNGEDIPYTLEDLCLYDEIVLSNVNIISLNNHEEFIINLEKVISKYGKSLSTYGATFASGTSSETMSKYNNMLPIQFEASDAKCLALVIDASSSMETDNRLDKAKEGAIACLDLLGEKDYVTVISFGDTTSVVQPLTSAKNREQIINSIRSIHVSYATNMTRGLQEAYNQIRNANFENKHVILLSDGLPSELDYYYSLPNIVETMTNNNIVTSFININCREGDYLMRYLASIGTGEYYYISRSSDIVNVILSSVADVVNETVIEGDFTINSYKNHDVLTENVSNLPNIKGYNFSRIKGSANTVYTVTYTNDLGGTREVPLLAYWTFGKGKVLSFTSTFTNSWAEELKTSEGGKNLFKNILDYLKPKEKITSSYEFSVATKGFSTELNIELDLVNENAYLQVDIYLPDETVITKYLMNESYFYNLVIPTEEKGIYKVTLTYRYLDYKYTDTKYFAYSYSQEYNYFKESNEKLLYSLLSENGKVMHELDYTLLNDETSTRYYESISIYLLITTLFLFIIDIFLRKLRLSDLRFIHKKKTKKIK